MKFQQLQVFVAVAREKSLRAAARYLDLTQPAVTRSVQELEADIGVALFARSVKGIELTAYGEILYLRASQILEDIRRAREELVQFGSTMKGKIAVGATASVAITFLPNAVQKFRQEAPDVDMTLLDLRLPQSIQQLRNGSVDFVTTHILPNTLDDDMKSIHFLSTDFVVVMRDGHPLAGAVRLEQLIEQEWLHSIWTVGDKGSVMARAFATENLQLPKRMIRCGSFAVALGLISQTDVIGLFTRPLAAKMSKYGLHEVALTNSLPAVQLGVIVRRDVQLTPAAQFFLEILKVSSREFWTVDGRTK